jgi:hypothetical protein
MAPLRLRGIWAIRVRLEMNDRKRELALFNLAIESKLRGGVAGIGHGRCRCARQMAASPRFPLSDPLQSVATGGFRVANSRRGISLTMRERGQLAIERCPEVRRPTVPRAAQATTRVG